MKNKRQSNQEGLSNPKRQKKLKEKKDRKRKSTEVEKSLNSFQEGTPLLENENYKYSIVVEKDKISFVWDYFGKLYKNDSVIDEGFNYCSKCLEKLNATGGTEASIRNMQKYKKGTSTTNMSHHLEREHDIRDRLIANTKTLTDYFVKSSETSGNKTVDKNYILARRLAILCCKSLVSYNCVSEEGFNDFLKSYGIVGAQVPHRTTLTRTALSDVYYETLPVVIKVAQKAKYCAITLDLWTDSYKRNGYITFNLSSITDEFKLQNINLRTRHMPGKHNHETISQQFHSTMKMFGIENIPFYIVSDQGSNIKKFVTDEKLDNQFCVGHGIHNLVNEGFGSVVEIDELLTKIKKVVRKLRFRGPELEEEDKSVKNEILCAIDSIDDVVMDDLMADNKMDEDGFTAAERLPLKLCSLLNNADDPIEAINETRHKTLKGFTVTRWHSVLIMLESLGSQRVAVNRVLCRLKKPMSVTLEEWDLMQHLIKFLGIFRSAVEMFSYDNKPTICNALLFRIELENALRSNSSDHYLIQMLKENMAENLEYRFPITEEILLGAILDPRLQNLEKLISELRKRGTTKFDFLKAALIKIAPNVNTETNLEKSSGKSPSEVKSKNVKRSLIHRLIEKHAYDPRTNDQDSLSDKIDEEMHKYFLTVVPMDEIDNFDPMKFWKNHSASLPFLAELMKKIFCIPVTSTSSERAFSSAGLLLTAKRSCLSPFVVEKTLFIHDNYGLVKKTIRDID